MLFIIIILISIIISMPSHSFPISTTSSAESLSIMKQLVKGELIQPLSPLGCQVGVFWRESRLDFFCFVLQLYTGVMQHCCKQPGLINLLLDLTNLINKVRSYGVTSCYYTVTFVHLKNKIKCRYFDHNDFRK